MPRGIEERIKWFLSNSPGGSGMCARHSWRSLGGDKGDPPAWSCPNANSVYDKVKKSGRYWSTTPPRGALVIWKYGKHGHAAISVGGGRIVTTDPSNKPGGTGEESIKYPSKWGAGSYIWTDQYNGVRFDVAGSIGTGKVYLSKLKFEQEDSDSVKRLQVVLNGISLTGGEELPITGGYFAKTKDEVSKWQSQKASDKSVSNGSYLTKDQAVQLFDGTGNTLVDDVSVPEPEEPEDDLPVDPSIDDDPAAGLWKWYSGKPGGEVKVYPDGDWHLLKGLEEPASGIHVKLSDEQRFLYLRLEFTKTRTADRVVETKFVRANGDATAYDSETFGTTKDSYPYNNIHPEAGDGNGGKWYVKVTGGKDPMTITTRYAKQRTIYIKED